MAELPPKPARRPLHDQRDSAASRNLSNERPRLTDHYAPHPRQRANEGCGHLCSTEIAGGENEGAHACRKKGDQLVSSRTDVAVLRQDDPPSMPNLAKPIGVLRGLLEVPVVDFDIAARLA